MKLLALAAAIAAIPGVSPGELRPDLRDLVASGAKGAVVLARNDQRTVSVAAGSLRTTDRFRIASITKSFVATVVLQLVGERRLRLDDTVEQWLPGVVANGRKITIRHLLRHQSGLYDYLEDQRIYAPYIAGKLDYYWSPRALVRVALSHKSLFAPGTSWAYSNTNYILLGLIVQRVTGQSLGAVLHSRLFKILDLRATSFGPGRPSQGRVAHSVVRGIDIAKASLSWAWASGAIVSTADEVARFYAGLFGGRLLSPALLHEMETTAPSATLEYGLGISIRRTDCGPGWGHVGQIPGYFSLAFGSPDGRRQVVLLATGTGLSPEGELAFDNLAVKAYCG